MRLSLSAVSIALLFSHAGAVLLPEESEEHQEQGNEQDERDLAYRLDPYPNTWIVQLREGSQSAVSQASQVAQNGNGRAGKVFEHALRGFVYYGDDPDTILRDPNVLSVTRDSVAKFTGQIEPSGVKRIFASQKPYMKKATASCRCDAIVAVIDSGVDFYHPDLRVNTAMSVDCTSGFCVKNAGNDNNGHGTHVAGIIGAVGGNNAGVVGVCPGAEIWSIKVLDSNGYGYTSWIIAGIDYVTSWGTKVDVANMSIETKGCYPSYCSAIAKAKAKGVAFAVAAGNSGQSASNYSPACCTNALSKFRKILLLLCDLKNIQLS
jgi:subtilisin family serine protease